MTAVTVECARCGAPSTMICRHCYARNYCSEACAVRDWPEHRREPIVCIETGAAGDWPKQQQQQLQQQQRRQCYQEDAADEIVALQQYLHGSDDASGDGDDEKSGGGVEVTWRLLLGSLAALTSRATMRNVAGVVSLLSPSAASRKTLAALLGADERRLAAGQRYTALHHVAVDDDERAPLAEHLEPAARFIEHWLAYGDVLVHCAAGHSRSAALVVYYVATRLRQPYASVDRALAYVRSRRHSAFPNDGFVEQVRVAVDRFYSNSKNASSSSLSAPARVGGDFGGSSRRDVAARAPCYWVYVPERGEWRPSDTAAATAASTSASQ